MIAATQHADLTLQHQRRWLGYAGLIPFIACLMVLLGTDGGELHAFAEKSLHHYAALIAASLGAVHWGCQTSEPRRVATARLIWGAIPGLLAWVLLGVPGNVSLLGFAALFALILVVDRHLLPLLDTGYRRMRLHLSVMVVSILLLAAMAGPMVSA